MRRGPRSSLTPTLKVERGEGRLSPAAFPLTVTLVLERFNFLPHEDETMLPPLPEGGEVDSDGGLVLSTVAGPDSASLLFVNGFIRASEAASDVRRRPARLNDNLERLVAC